MLFVIFNMGTMLYSFFILVQGYHSIQNLIVLDSLGNSSQDSALKNMSFDENMFEERRFKSLIIINEMKLGQHQIPALSKRIKEVSSDIVS